MTPLALIGLHFEKQFEGLADRFPNGEAGPVVLLNRLQLTVTGNGDRVGAVTAHEDDRDPPDFPLIKQHRGRFPLGLGVDHLPRSQ